MFEKRKEEKRDSVASSGEMIEDVEVSQVIVNLDPKDISLVLLSGLQMSSPSQALGTSLSTQAVAVTISRMSTTIKTVRNMLLDWQLGLNSALKKLLKLVDASCLQATGRTHHPINNYQTFVALIPTSLASAKLDTPNLQSVQRLILATLFDTSTWLEFVWLLSAG